jgi:hypothetical protein
MLQALERRTLLLQTRSSLGALLLQRYQLDERELRQH